MTCLKSSSYANIVGVFSADRIPDPGQRFRSSICSASLALSFILRIWEVWTIAQPTSTYCTVVWRGIPVYVVPKSTATTRVLGGSLGSRGAFAVVCAGVDFTGVRCCRCCCENVAALRFWSL
jgi:hypothetical protein